MMSRIQHYEAVATSEFAMNVIFVTLRLTLSLRNQKTQFRDSKNSVPSFPTKLRYFHKTQLKKQENSVFQKFQWSGCRD